MIFLTEVHKRLELYLTIPVTTASSERNFSVFKRIKTYLRNSMTQQHLNHCMVFHSHQERTGALDLNSIAKEFAQENGVACFFNNFFGPYQNLLTCYNELVLSHFRSITLLSV